MGWLYTVENESHDATGKHSNARRVVCQALLPSSLNSSGKALSIVSNARRVVCQALLPSSLNSSLHCFLEAATSIEARVLTFLSLILASSIAGDSHRESHSPSPLRGAVLNL